MLEKYVSLQLFKGGSANISSKNTPGVDKQQENTPDVDKQHENTVKKTIPKQENTPDVDKQHKNTVKKTIPKQNKKDNNHYTKNNKLGFNGMVGEDKLYHRGVWVVKIDDKFKIIDDNKLIEKFLIIKMKDHLNIME